MRRPLALVAAVLALASVAAPALAEEVRVKDIGRFQGWRDNALVGYGVVIGLSGSGDSPRSEVTRQALKNVLGRLGVNVSPDQVQSRNVAAVMVTATLPPSANIGDRIDVTVSSIGDARSLVGGTLLMTPLVGPDQRSYALAQGQLVIGGYRFDADLNRQQKNYPTSGVMPGGATVEAAVDAHLLGPDGALTFILKDPDFTTAERVADAINLALGGGVASVRDADAVSIAAQADRARLYRLIARIENVRVNPDAQARVVINERSGTVVAGGGVRISSVVISQGDVRVSVTAENQASQPIYGYAYGGVGGEDGGVRSLIVTNTKLEVTESKDAVVQFPDTTVADLVQGLTRAHVDTRSTIAILQAIKAAGALHADILVQ
ncbi:flagellar biosynthesis protein FlgI [Caulobacter radicis]|uniref:flagellar basal body P-ring protein FlgI n=1 Tax=Caulobacter radicis TaxID=2172650 RepID=UPI000D56A5EC|nr:flagellar basal body P-ring protein FlgI [Caulobacter radicis]PVM84411.1 flagellar biosynthesis protein FlgI [Caulobacter radicis]